MCFESKSIFNPHIIFLFEDGRLILLMVFSHSSIILSLRFPIPVTFAAFLSISLLLPISTSTIGLFLAIGEPTKA